MRFQISCGGSVTNESLSLDEVIETFEEDAMLFASKSLAPTTRERAILAELPIGGEYTSLGCHEVITRIA